MLNKSMNVLMTLFPNVSLRHVLQAIHIFRHSIVGGTGLSKNRQTYSLVHIISCSIV